MVPAFHLYFDESTRDGQHPVMTTSWLHVLNLALVNALDKTFGEQLRKQLHTFTITSTLRVTAGTRRDDDCAPEERLLTLKCDELDCHELHEVLAFCLSHQNITQMPERTHLYNN
ncbi:hypothetical protein Pelo_18179 [Pelomyxa schiedti]|nr:hypothetical protein Pelo_18179 [Pelomyxa schiedti]